MAQEVKSIVYVLNEILYEYNDNTYDRDGSNSVKVYRTKEEAQEEATKRTIQELKSLDRPYENYGFDRDALEFEYVANKYNIDHRHVDEDYSAYYHSFPKEQQERIAEKISQDFYEISPCEIVGGKYGIGYDQAGG